MPRPKRKKYQLDFQMQSFMLKSFGKKNYQKRITSLGSLPTLKIFSVGICSHISSSRFLPISGHFGILLENQIWSSQSRKVSWNRGKEFECQ